MIWRDHVFNYGPKSVTRATKFREKKLALAETVFSRNSKYQASNIRPQNISMWPQNIDIWAQNIDIWPQNIDKWPQNIDIWAQTGRFDYFPTIYYAQPDL